MTDNLTPGQKFRQAVADSNPLQVLGTTNAYHAMMAEKSGAKAIYLSGGGVANASYGLPDLGMTSLSDVLDDVRRVTSAVDIPLLVDADTGWGSAFNINRTIKEMIKAGAAGVHIEDQVMAKRCGHRPNKEIVSQQEMVDRIKAATDARTNDFVIMARTDALAVEGMQSAIDRAMACVEAGADMIFPEAINTGSCKYHRVWCHATVYHDRAGFRWRQAGALSSFRFPCSQCRGSESVPGDSRQGYTAGCCRHHAITYGTVRLPRLPQL
jgi:methylisocitrate lyase